MNAPLVGPESARFSRTYFTTAAVVLGAISSAYAYFHSPFTQLCDCSEDEACTIADTTFADVVLLNGTTIDSIETSSNEVVKFCKQKIYPFPPFPRKQGSDVWMTESQESVNIVIGNFVVFLSLAYVVFIVFLFLARIRKV